MLYKYGNKKIGNDTLIINMGRASNCPSWEMGLCRLKELGVKCYALKPEIQYPDVVPSFRDAQFAFWRNSSAQDIANELIASIGRRRLETKYMRFNESGDFWSQEDVDKLDIVARKLKEVHGVVTYGYTARKDLKFKKNRSFIVRGSGWKIRNANGETKVILRGKKIPKGFKECPGSCVSCMFCKTDKKINVAFRQH